MSSEMLTHCYDWLRQVIDCKGNHIITLAVQAHNGERSEPHNSKLKTDRKRDNISAKNRELLQNVQTAQKKRLLVENIKF